MRKCLLSMLLGMFLLSGFATLALGGDLKSQRFGTGVFPCTGTLRRRTWTNETGSTLYIKQAQLSFSGLGPGSRTDIAGTVYRPSDGSIILGTTWGHYADPTTLHQYTVKFSPDYFTLEDGDTLQLEYLCTMISRDVQGEITVTIWYTVDKP